MPKTATGGHTSANHHRYLPRPRVGLRNPPRAAASGRFAVVGRGLDRAEDAEALPDATLAASLDLAASVEIPNSLGREPISLAPDEAVMSAFVRARRPPA
jgi:hypothetical protein